MGRPPKRRVFRTSLCAESLERREVFAADFAQNLYDYAYFKSLQPTPATNKLLIASNQADFDAKLKDLVQQHWADVFGKRPSEIANYGNYWSPGYFALETQQGVVRLSTADNSFTSATNTRHTSIDEGDAVDMTNDGYLYSVLGGDLYVVNLSDPSDISATKLSDVEGFTPQLIVSGDSLIVVQQMTSTNMLTGEALRSTNTEHTSVKLYDISNRLSPRIVSTTLVDGTNYGVRFSDGLLTLVNYVHNYLPLPKLVVGDLGIETYETLNSYYAANRDAIIAAIVPNYGQSNGEEKPESFVDAGTWDDLAFANDNLDRATSVVRLRLDDDGLTLTDAETITGVTPNLVYQGLDDVYVITSAAWVSSNDSSYIYKVDATEGGQLKTLGVADVKGRVSSTTWLNEYNGVLHVASTGNMAVAMPFGGTNLVITLADPVVTTLPIINPIWPTTRFNTANITTIGDTGNGWKVLGTLEDIGDGQSLLAASFLDDQAVITTGIPQFFDPLHGIDLSDPAHPKELSELTIPGFTTYLKQIDATHWLGFGNIQSGENRVPMIQVSLYEGADLSNPRVVDSWTMNNTFNGSIWDPHAISYDPATGLLVMSEAQQWNSSGQSRLPILKVDVDADDPLHQLNSVPLRDYGNRSFTMGNVLVVLTTQSVTTYDMADSAKQLSKEYLQNYDALTYAYWSVQSGTTQDWRLADQWTGEPFVITSVTTSGDITATLQADQSTIRLSAPAGAEVYEQNAAITVRFESGATHVVRLTLRAGAGYPPPIDYTITPIYAEGRASIGADFTDDAGNPVTELTAGDEVWVSISITDLRDNPLGVFGGYVDVDFESQNVSLVGQLEYLEFENGRRGSVTDNGIESFGGFTDGQLPTTPTGQLGRFKIHVNDDKPVSIRVTASTKRNEEVLVHQADRGLDPANIESALLTTQPETISVAATAENSQQDINSDGLITALDVLQIVNYINTNNAAAAESVNTLRASQVAPTRYDLSGDGVVSGLDVLQIVNTINARYNAPASGEGGALDASAVDQLVAFEPMLAVDLDTITKRR